MARTIFIMVEADAQRRMQPALNSKTDGVRCVVLLRAYVTHSFVTVPFWDRHQLVLDVVTAVGSGRPVKSAS